MKGAAHRAAPLADSPTSSPKSTDLKKALPPSSRRTRFVPDALLVKELNRVANSSSQKRALETVVPGDGSPFKATAVSSVDGAKVSLRSSASQPVRQEIAKQDLNSAAKVRRKLVF